ncbi:MAG: PH domain-containing protein [Firmicutes bacterium]|jgi:uncharacterized membrane protein YdbT with pleckstrin-like domain|nr:PH domain-containing protein [Bacillota bacterium]
MERVEFRNHVLIIFKKIIGLFIAVAIFLARLIDKVNIFEEGGAVFIILAVVSFLLILVTTNAYIKWKNTIYTISNGYLNYKYRGLFRKKNKEVRLSQISNINLERSLLDKVFSIGKVKIDISSSHTAKETDFEILLSMNEAERIKEILSLKTSNEVVEEVLADETNIASEEHKDFTACVENIKRINFKNIFDRSIISGLSKKGSYSGQSHTRNFTPWEGIRHSVFDISIFSILFFGFALFMMFSEMKDKGRIVALFIILRSVYDLAKSLNEKINFSCKREGDHLEIQYGMMNTDRFTIPVNKITGIGSKQSLFSRMFGYTALRITAVGVGNDKSENQMMSLYMKNTELDDYLSKILPEYQLENSYMKQSVKVLFISLIPSLTVCISLGYMLSGFFEDWRMYIYIISTCLALLNPFLGYLNEGLHVTEESIVIQKGVFRIIRETIDYSEIDQISLIQGPLYRLVGLRKLKIMYKGNSGAKTLVSGYYSGEVFS